MDPKPATPTRSAPAADENPDCPRRPPFRREALDRLMSPDPLDDPMMLPAGKPFALAGLLVFVATVLVWVAARR